MTVSPFFCNIFVFINKKLATARPFAFNPGPNISGTIQVGDLSVGTPTSGFTSSPQFWNGPDEELGYVIAIPVSGNTQPTQISGVTASVGFFRTDGFNDGEFIQLAETVSNEFGNRQSFSTALDASVWLTNNGFWNSFIPVFVTPTPSVTTTQTNTPTPTNTTTTTSTPTSTQAAGLLINLDSGNLISYPGTGTTWYDLAGTANNATLFNSPTYSSSYNGILQFDDASLEYGTIPNIGSLSNWTVEVWFRLTTALTGKVASIVSNQFDLVNKLNFSIGTNNAPSNYNLAVGYYNGAWRTTTGFVPQTNVWYQVVGTYDGSTIRQYVNGSASGGTLSYVGTSQSGGEVRLMRRWDETLSSGNLADGDLAIVKIYNTALSSSDILQSYNNTYTRFLEPTPTPTTTSTPTVTPTNTTTSTPTNSTTPTQTPTNTITPTNSETPTQTPTPTQTNTPTSTNTPTVTPTSTQLYFLLFEDSSIATAENNDNIEIDII
jgi:cell division septation protein DedD